MQIIISKFNNQIFKFLFVGGLAFFIEFCVFIILIKLFPNILFIYNIAQTFSMIFGALVSFFLNKLWSFKSEKNTFLQGIKYTIVFISNLFITNVLLNLFHYSFLINNLFLIKIILVCLTTTWNFFLYKYFVYRR